MVNDILGYLALTTSSFILDHEHCILSLPTTNLCLSVTLAFSLIVNFFFSFLAVALCCSLTWEFKEDFLEEKAVIFPDHTLHS